jgi:molybdopterin molybdotransferase
MATPMLNVPEAQRIVLEQVRPLPAQTIPLSPAALGLVLADDVASDLDMPPFDKALMDGYALRAADAAEPGTTLAIIEEVTAGQVPTRPVQPGQATRIMTGAQVPQGADAVVMVERTTQLDEGRVRIDVAMKPEANLLRRGREMRRGETILRAGARLRPQEFGLLAMVGRTTATMQPRPDVGVLPTGDEIVDSGHTPGPGQIRNSNGPMLMAQVARAGAAPRWLGIARDTLDSMRGLVSEGLRCDALILSGGVSAGKLDLVPGVLGDLGVRTYFHKVAMKPGKPMLFGVKEHGPDRPPTYVFGLPGNPVSSLVCFELFVRPALRRMMALPPGPRLIEAALAEDFPYRTDRTTYHPARLDLTPQGWSARVVPWFGSPDLRGVASSNAFVVLPEGDHRHRAGDRLSVLVVEEIEW